MLILQLTMIALLGMILLWPIIYVFRPYRLILTHPELWKLAKSVQHNPDDWIVQSVDGYLSPAIFNDRKNIGIVFDSSSRKIEIRIGDESNPIQMMQITSTVKLSHQVMIGDVREYNFIYKKFTEPFRTQCNNVFWRAIGNILTEEK